MEALQVLQVLEKARSLCEGGIFTLANVDWNKKDVSYNSIGDLDYVLSDSYIDNQLVYDELRARTLTICRICREQYPHMVGSAKSYITGYIAQEFEAITGSKITVKEAALIAMAYIAGSYMSENLESSQLMIDKEIERLVSR